MLPGLTDLTFSMDDEASMSQTDISGMIEPLALGEWFEIDQQRIDQFADVTEDHQYIHIDPERAKKTDLGGTIAHGFLSLSLLPKLSEGCIPMPDNMVMGINYGFDKVRFLNPVRPGDRVRFCAFVDALVPRGENMFLQKLAVTVEIEGKDKPALACDWINLFVVG